MGAIFWPAFLAALAANAITATIIYARAQDRLRANPKGSTLMNVGLRAVQLYIGLIFLGAIAYAIKLMFFGE